MLLLEGLRVVRGPEWKYGDQDGGEGNTGTVQVDEREPKQKLLRPQMVSVRWDSSEKRALYRCGPKGSLDLRVVDNSATGVKHPNIPCGGADCSVKEICGIRWQCATCDTNFCSKCFFKEIPYHPHHNQFKRFDSDKTTEPPIVSSWSADGGPKSRVKMTGGMLGYYHPVSLPVLDNSDSLLNETVCFPFRSSSSLFCVGDQVCLDPVFPIEELKIKVVESGGFGDYVDKVMGAIGTVESVGDSKIYVNFKDKEVKLHLNPACFDKLNKFSIHQIVRIRKDSQTIQEIESDFKIRCRNLVNNEPQGAIGRVIGISFSNYEELLIQFDNQKIYEWMDKGKYLPSSWLELYETVQPIIDEQIVELELKVANLFFDAIYAGDLRSVQLLHARHGIDLDRRNADGQTALHLACQEGHHDVVQWLIDRKEIDPETEDNFGYRAIHHAVTRCDPQLLKILLEHDIELDSKTKSGETALDMAVASELKECARLLIRHGCDVNTQDLDGNTVLHRALGPGSSEMIEILTSSGRINWNLRNKERLNIFGLAVRLNALKLIKHFLKTDPTFILEWTSNSGLSVFYYACLYRHRFKLVKLLLDQPYLKEKATVGGSSSPSRMQVLLEAVDKSGRTPLLQSCWGKSCATIELLVEAGANLKVSDEDGNTAIILAASSSFQPHIPRKDDSPALFKLYQDQSIKKHLILPILIYLIQKGCCWETTNKAGKKASDFLLEKGFSKELIDFLDQTAAKLKIWPVGPKGCMGQNGRCASEATFRLNCPHKATFVSCSGCVSFAFKLKCGCAEEEMLPIPTGIPVASQTASCDDSVLSESRLDVLKWIDDGTEQGYIKDQSGNKFYWNGRTRADGSFGYRCKKKLYGLRGNKCPAVARRYLSQTKENCTILLETPHKHPAPTNRRSTTDESDSDE